MQCPRCHAENRDGLRFCEDCGARLAATCASCSAEVTPGKRFCGKCGEPVGSTTPESRLTSPQSYTPKHLAERILTSKSALEGERKQVTVLFADLKGSMELLADRDPEEARKILDPVLERMMDAVHHYEGTVNQVMGDGIMALFGAPLAHEDHAVRACYAALRMQESVKRYAEDIRRAEGIPIQIRVGLNSGEVVVRSIGNDLYMDYTAVGQTTHLAARMEQMAIPGSILIPQETLNLAEGYVVVKPLGPMAVKGMEGPIEVYEVTAAATVRSRLHAAAARGLTRFVGRESELEQLRHALERARSGYGQIVAVVGEPGVGKSRLYWEFTHSHRTQGWLIVESGSVSYGKATAFLPIIELLRAYFQVEARDEARKIREKVTGKVLSLDRALEPSLPALLWLLDVPVEDAQWERLDPNQRRQRTLDSLKRLLLRESHVQPLLVLFEDLHWIDAETQALLDSLVESLPTARLLLLVNYRPAVQAILAARIDRLAPEAKRLLQAAAVIGKDVPMPLLLAIADAAEPEVRAEITHLQAAELLYETRLFPDVEYTFKHALTHEVAYQGLLHDRQRALHARIAEAIEQLSAERVAEQAERLAHHALRGELWEKAVSYLRQAGHRAMARAAYREVLVHLEQALGALRRLPETQETTELTIDIHLDLSTALAPLGDSARRGEHLHEAERLARTLGDQHRLARIASSMVGQCQNTGDYADALRFGQEALSIARTLGDRSVEVVTTSFLGMAHAARGEFSDAASLLERGVVLEGDLRSQRVGTFVIQSAYSGARLAEVLSQLGRFDEAIGHAEAAVRIAEAADHPYTLYVGLSALGFAHLRRGDLPRATRVVERGLDLCRTWQFVLGTPQVAATLGVTYALAGRADEALPLVAGAVEEFRRRQNHTRPALILLWAGMTCLSAGRIDEAASYALEALALTRRLGARGNEAHALCLSGDVASTVGAADAEGYYRQALALANELGMRPLVGDCHLGLGKLRRRMGKHQEAREHLNTATTMYREMDMGFWLERAEKEMKES